MIIDDFERIASLKQQWVSQQSDSPQYVHYLFQNPNTDNQNFKLPKVCLKSNAIEQNKQKFTFRKKVRTFHDSNDTEQFQLHSSRMENIIMMNNMTHKFEQLKQDQQSVLITKNKLSTLKTQSVHQAPQMFFKPQQQDFTSELKMIQASRQKFMRCVMDTRQRNRSLQLYGDDLSPVIDKEKAMQRSLVEQKVQQNMLHEIRKQYTQRSPLGNAYCGLKALSRRSQDKVLRRLI